MIQFMEILHKSVREQICDHVDHFSGAPISVVIGTQKERCSSLVQVAIGNGFPVAKRQPFDHIITGKIRCDVFLQYRVATANSSSSLAFDVCCTTPRVDVLHFGIEDSLILSGAAPFGVLSNR